LIRALTGISVSPEADVIEVDTTILGALGSLFMGDRAIAVYDERTPQFGCTLTKPN
jgi:hypothetical protein